VRIALVDTLYPAFVAEHYAARPGLEHRGSGEQRSALLARSFGTADAYSTNLRALGHDATDLLVDVEPLQRAWAREHGLRVSRPLRARLPGPLHRDDRAWLRAIARAQIAQFQADVVYCQDLSFFPPGELRELHEEGRLVVGQIASAPPDTEQLRVYDLLLSSFPHYVERFQALGVDSAYLRIAFDERVLDRLRDVGVDPDPAAPGRSGAVFVGGLDPRVHAEGVARWERLITQAPFDVYGYGGDRLAPDSALREAWRGEAWGLEMYAALARSGIALNRHIAAAEGFANNMRLFEATGVGALLVTEAAPNLGDLFEPGSEVVTYRDDDELAAVLRHYLDNPEERQAIAAAGQRRTLAEHTYGRRMAELVELLEPRLR